MKVIIDIPEEVFEEFKTDTSTELDLNKVFILKAIKNGVPLNECKPIDKSDEVEEWELNEDKDYYLRIGDIVDRFKEIDEYYNHSPWNLTQIFSNLNILQRVECKADDITFKDDNAVSRLSVRDIIYANAYELEYPDSSSEYVVNRDEIIKYLMELPSVYPKSDKRIGKWIKLDNWMDVGVRVKCSECNQVFVIGDRVSRNYCGNCGAKMELQEDHG